MQLHEQYRPTRWEELVGQKRIVKRIDRLRKRGLGGRAYWISGPSGTGKTTIARLIAAEVASEWATEEADATDLTAARVRDLERESHLRGLGTPNERAYIVNEAHGMNKRVVRQFLTTLERIPSHVVWLFTTIPSGQKLLFEGCVDASPLVSRCVRLDLGIRSPVYFARRARKIARIEGFDSKPLDEYVELVRKHNFNFRAVLQEIEAGVMEK
jgi:DNA polymerase-3 subunit gamma/tau